MERPEETRRLMERLGLARRQIEEFGHSTADVMFGEVADRISEVFWLFDHRDHKVLYVSPAYERIWGRPAHKLYSNRGDWLESVHPADREQASASFAAIAASGGGGEREYRIVRPDGSVRWISDRGFAVRDAAGDAIWIVGVAEDITAQRMAEEALEQVRDEYRRLASIVISAQESERSRIARELHDDITQRLTRLAMDAAVLQRSDAELSPEILCELDRLQRGVEDAAVHVQALSRALHPTILRDLGLCDAMLSECTALRDREGLQVSVALDEAPADLAEDVALSLFRILQEALRNITKYSCAKRVEVSFRTNEGHLLLTVRDDGIGFDIQPTTSRPGLGLISMQERARLIFGELSIHSQPGQGTTIEARVPFPEPL